MCWIPGSEEAGPTASAVGHATPVLAGVGQAVVGPAAVGQAVGHAAAGHVVEQADVGQAGPVLALHGADCRS